MLTDGYYKELYFGVLDKTSSRNPKAILGSRTHPEADLAVVCHRYGLSKEETSAELSLFNAIRRNRLGLTISTCVRSG